MFWPEAKCVLALHTCYLDQLRTLISSLYFPLKEGSTPWWGQKQKTQVSSFHLSSFLPYTHYLVHTVALPGAPTRVSPASLGSLMTEMPSPEEAFVSLCCCSVGQSCPTLCDPMDCSPPGSWFLGPRGFSRQEYQSGLPCLPPGDLPSPGIEPRSPALQAIQILCHLSHQGSPRILEWVPIQGIFPIQESNQGLLHCRRSL